jgi:iron(III) transport system ATP-binding protein
MVSVSLKDVTKTFGAVQACRSVSFEADDGEMFTLLGPSGCGKTTALRTIAGFYLPDSGEVYFGNRDVTTLPPEKRNTGMVFQNYALWPHMSVHDNIAYGLKIRKLGKNEIEGKIANVIELLELKGLEKRTPLQLSGGQQQRVALARALVIEPDVLLLDEPLSNLDAKLRVRTRVELTRLQRRLGITAIYVTHDQEEALCISNRIAIMRDGQIQQIGTPREIYERPTAPFVADFIGVANMLPGRVKGHIRERKLVSVELASSREVLCATDVPLAQNEKVFVVFRPEGTRIVERKADSKNVNMFEGKVAISTYLGDVLRYEVDSSDGTLRADIQNPVGVKVLDEGTRVTLVVDYMDCRAVPVPET